VAQNEETNKIVLPDDQDLRYALEFKREEYLGRMAKKARECPDLTQGQLDVTTSGYKARLVKVLLDKGVMDVDEVLVQTAQQDGTLFNHQNFSKALKILKDYVTTGGKHVHGGTGLYAVHQQ
jgi:ribosomal protein S18